MISYSFIESLFKSVLKYSFTLQGRFFFLPRSGQELNSDELHQVIVQANGEQKYPAAFLMPPRSEGIFSQNDQWEEYRFVMFFLNTTYYTGDGQIAEVDPATQTSMRPVMKEWEDMKSCAIDFVKVLRLVQKGHNAQGLSLVNNYFRINNDSILFDPVSFVSVHRLSGVRLSFRASVFAGCELSDYASDFVVTLPNI